MALGGWQTHADYMRESNDTRWMGTQDPLFVPFRRGLSSESTTTRNKQPRPVKCSRILLCPLETSKTTSAHFCIKETALGEFSALRQEYVMPDCLELKVVNDRGEAKTDLLHDGQRIIHDELI